MRQALHVVTLDALMASRRWEPGDVVFQGGTSLHAGVCTPASLRVRLATYPDETAAAWLAKARARREELASSVGPIEEDLRRWLPSSWPLTGVAVQSMVQLAVAALDEGLRAMRRVEAQSRAEPAGSSS